MREDVAPTVTAQNGDSRLAPGDTKSATFHHFPSSLILFEQFSLPINDCNQGNNPEKVLSITLTDLGSRENFTLLEPASPQHLHSFSPSFPQKLRKHHF